MASSPQTPLQPPAPLRILIVRIGAMGDILHGLPAVAALRARLPDAVIGWAVEPRWQDLLAGPTGTGPIVDRIHLVPTREWKHKPFSTSTLRSIVQLRRELREARYDVCVDLQGTIRSAMIGRMAEAPGFFGPARPRESQAKALYRERVPTHAPHVIDQACELIQPAIPASADPNTRIAPAPIALPFIPAAEQWCDARLQQLGLASARFVLFSPAAGWGSKQWPEQRYRELARLLQARGLRVLLNAGTAADAARIAAIAADGTCQVVDCTVAQLIALIRRAGLVIGGDSGPVHLAAALGRPVVSLFGPTDPGRNGPHFPAARFKVLRHPTSRLERARLQDTEAGLARISEHEVLEAALDLLSEAHPHG